MAVMPMAVRLTSVLPIESLPFEWLCCSMKLKTVKPAQASETRMTPRRRRKLAAINTTMT
jgi:hypothetical protein